MTVNYKYYPSAILVSVVTVLTHPGVSETTKSRPPSMADSQVVTTDR